MPLLDVATSDGNGRAEVVLRGELDISTAPDLGERLAEVESSGPAVLLLDLRGLEFMDSTGLRVVMAADARAREAERRLVLVRGRDTVQRVFTLTGLEQRLDFVDDPSSVA